MMLVVFLFYSCKNASHRNTRIEAKTIAIDSSLKSDASYIRFIEPYREQMITKINTILTYASKDLVRTDGNRQSSLGNLMADLCYERANPLFEKQFGKTIDFAMFNYGGIRSGIFKGNVTYRNVFELMPFENTFVVVELSGEKAKELIHYFIKNKKAHPLSKQVILSIDGEGYALKIGNELFDSKKTYRVLTSNYLQSGGDRMDFFKNPIKLYKLAYKVRDAITDYFRVTDTLAATLDNRVTIK
ncbi:MAG: UDP-sugar hydrolase [Flavobacteriaceae bacterium]|nr:MAG: UDP-sugar hydrolase [Flavobacteriaceae bacterium]